MAGNNGFLSRAEPSGPWQLSQEGILAAGTPCSGDLRSQGDDPANPVRAGHSGRAHTGIVVGKLRGLSSPFSADATACITPLGRVPDA